MQPPVVPYHTHFWCHVIGYNCTWCKIEYRVYYFNINILLVVWLSFWVSISDGFGSLFMLILFFPVLGTECDTRSLISFILKKVLIRSLMSTVSRATTGHGYLSQLFKIIILLFISFKKYLHNPNSKYMYYPTPHTTQRHYAGYSNSTSNPDKSF